MSDEMTHGGTPPRRARTWPALLLCLILAAGLGILSQRILGFKMGGLLVSIFIGFIGAVLGRELVYWFHLPTWGIELHIAGRSFPVIWCTIGGLLANTGRNSAPEIPHLHVHIFGGRPLGPMLSR